MKQLKRSTRKEKIAQSKKAVKQAIGEVDIFTSPESSNVEGGSYTPDTKEAVIAFRDKKLDGAPTIFYRYQNVLLADWQALKNADSKGKHMASVFTRKYKGERMEG